MKYYRTIIQSFSAIILIAIVAVFTTSSLAEPFVRGKLEIVSGKKRHLFVVELAQTLGQREQGLMERKSLPLNTGMLFLFDNTEIQHMWMKNTFIPLDMLFADKNGRIVTITHNTEPQSRKIISSRVPARYVLELRAGTAARLVIKVGDRLRLLGKESEQR